MVLVNFFLSYSIAINCHYAAIFCQDVAAFFAKAAAEAISREKTARIIVILVHIDKFRDKTSKKKNKKKTEKLPFAIR